MCVVNSTSDTTFMTFVRMLGRVCSIKSARGRYFICEVILCDSFCNQISSSSLFNDENLRGDLWFVVDCLIGSKRLVKIIQSWSFLNEPIRILSKLLCASEFSLIMCTSEMQSVRKQTTYIFLVFIISPFTGELTFENTSNYSELNLC